MKVRFKKEDRNRYSISAMRRGGNELMLGVAPGYDPCMPHDLQHFIVEEQLGLRHAIFGQLAAGGDAGTFIARAHGDTGRAIRRKQKSTRKKGKALMNTGSEEANLSEKATIIVLYHFFDRSGDPALKARAAEIMDTATSTLRLLPPVDQSRFAEKPLARMVMRMQSLSDEWRSLEVGQSLEVEWSPETNRR